MSMCGYVDINASAWKNQKKASDFQQLEFQRLWANWEVLGGRTVIGTISALNRWAISPEPGLSYSKNITASMLPLTLCRGKEAERRHQSVCGAPDVIGFVTIPYGDSNSSGHREHVFLLAWMGGPRVLANDIAQKVSPQWKYHSLKGSGVWYSLMVAARKKASTLALLHQSNSSS